MGRTRALGVAIALFFGVVVVGPALLYGYGSTLPEGHTVTVVVEVGAPREAVEARVRDWRTSATWRPGVSRVEDLGHVDGLQRFRECAWDCVDFQIERVEGAYVTRIVDHPDFGGTWTWRFEPIVGGTRVTLTEEGVIPNPMFRLLMRHVFGISANIEDTARALERSFRGT